MDKSRPKTVDASTVQRQDVGHGSWQLTRKQLAVALASLLLVVVAFGAVFWYLHRNDQRVIGDQYQVVYLLSGQVYFGKLQNTTGEYLTLRNVYTLQSNDEAADAQEETNILQVSRQVYGPEDSMAIRADQVQFWQNLRTDSKVAQAIDSVNK